MTTVGGDWLTATGTQAVLAALSGSGHQALPVGGCVRNALLGVPVDDVDIATDATPEEVIRIVTAAGLKAVPTGLDHGTITVVADHRGYEVTTFRADVETFGRHATVRFSTDISEDAARRDFTMNALYCTASGELVDPLNGLPDLIARRVRFIGDASQRIREDYLRILRFFRFSAWYADPDHGFDPDALAAIADNLEGLDDLSRERVGTELTKLLKARDPAPSICCMAQIGVLAHVVPGADPRALAPLVLLEQQTGTPPDSIRRLAALGMVDGQGLRLPKKEIRRLKLYQSLIGNMQPAGELGYRHGYDIARDVILLRSAVLEMPLDAVKLDDAKTGAEARFPIRPADLMPAYQGADLGAKLRELEARWIASGFTLDRESLLG